MKASESSRCAFFAGKSENRQNPIALRRMASYSSLSLNTTESRYIEKKMPARSVLCKDARRLDSVIGREGDWLRVVKEDFPKFIPFLRRSGVEFRGRILEIGAGEAWFSAELSKLPRVVEVVVTDISPKMLKEYAPKVFKLLNAQEGKIIRMPADFHKLDFPDKHFDFVVCSAILHRASSMMTVLREAKRVLKPGGQFVAIREPVLPLVRWKSSRRKVKRVSSGRNYTLADYRQFFAAAGLKLQTKRLTLSTGFKYYFDKMVNGLTHARYVFVATARRRT
jgi:SAM-dependent methyltransferase